MTEMIMRSLHNDLAFLLISVGTYNNVIIIGRLGESSQNLEFSGKTGRVDRSALYAGISTIL